MARTSNAFIYQILLVLFLYSVVVKSNSTVTNGSLNKQDNSNGTNTSHIVLDNPDNATKNQSTQNGSHNEISASISPTRPTNLTMEKTKFATSTNVSASYIGSSSVSLNTTSTVKIVASTQKSTTTTTKTTPKPKKPLITEKDVVELHADNPDTSLPSMVHIDASMDKKVRRADYIVPIVAVILSVPLVAIIISVLYKRGKDWWQHRHYRRMDFLIEGMYNS